MHLMTAKKIEEFKDKSLESSSFNLILVIADEKKIDSMLHDFVGRIARTRILMTQFKLNLPVGADLPFQYRKLPSFGFEDLAWVRLTAKVVVTCESLPNSFACRQRRLGISSKSIFFKNNTRN